MQQLNIPNNITQDSKLRINKKKSMQMKANSFDEPPQKGVHKY